MGRSDFPPLRSLPRLFLPGAPSDGPIELPRSELDKFRKVLRLKEGGQIAILPNDGSLIRCSLEGSVAIPIAVEYPQTERSLKVIIAQALPKGDRLEIVVRMCTEIGVAGFVFFPADRSVVRWEAGKVDDKLRRLGTIARESAEQSFRCVLPTLQYIAGFESLLAAFPEAIVLSEAEGEGKLLGARLKSGIQMLTEVGAPGVVLVVGPEGGWSPREMGLIGSRGYSLGPLVLRTDTAGVAAAAMMLL